MDREFTPREKGMLLVMAVLLLALGYMKLFYAPVQQAVEDNQQRQTELQDQALIEQTRALKMQVMEKELEELTRRCTFFGTRTIGTFRVLDHDDILAIYRMANH
jgi:type II secretory pathway component PulM